MAAFREYIEQQDFVEFILNEMEGPSQAVKPWSAKKSEIMQMWANLRQDTPIYMTPIAKKKPGETGGHSYGEDGIRVTGSWPFISSVIGRMKDVLAYENPQTKLRLVFRGVDQSRTSSPERQTFVFYVNLEERSQRKSSQLKKIEI